MRKIIWVIIIILILAGGYWYGSQVWWPKKQLKIQLGLAEPDFPWWDYTQEELEKLYPQIRYADIPTRITPEETYAKFREALRTNNLELALEQLSEESGKYEENKNKLRTAFEENKFNVSLSLYPVEVWRSTFSESSGGLCYNQERDNEKFVGCTDFLKDSNGDWKMDSL
jgi:hypothetical protein